MIDIYGVEAPATPKDYAIAYCSDRRGDWDNPKSLEVVQWWLDVSANRIAELEAKPRLGKNQRLSLEGHRISLLHRTNQLRNF